MSKKKMVGKCMMPKDFWFKNRKGNLLDRIVPAHSKNNGFDEGFFIDNSGMGSWGAWLYQDDDNDGQPDNFLKYVTSPISTPTMNAARKRKNIYT